MLAGLSGGLLVSIVCRLCTRPHGGTGPVSSLAVGLDVLLAGHGRVPRFLTGLRLCLLGGVSTRLRTVRLLAAGFSLRLGLLTTLSMRLLIGTRGGVRATAGLLLNALALSLTVGTGVHIGWSAGTRLDLRMRSGGAGGPRLLVSSHVRVLAGVCLIGGLSAGLSMYLLAGLSPRLGLLAGLSMRLLARAGLVVCLPGGARTDARVRPWVCLMRCRGIAR